jgi:hypothetical protein
VNASQILNIIRNQALVGNSGLASDTQKLVDYLNMAYRKVFDIIVRDYPFFAATTQTVIVTDGVGTLDPVPFYVLSVRNVGGSSLPLEKKSVEEIQSEDNALNARGAPCYWYEEGFGGIRTYPVNSTTLAVRVVPNAAILSADSPESAILIPPMFHDILVWETLKIVAYDERDKASPAELAMAERMYEDIEGRLLTYLATRTAQTPLRSKGVM